MSLLSRRQAAFGGIGVLTVLAATLVAVVALTRKESGESDWLPTYDSEDHPPSLLVGITGPLLRQGDCLYANDGQQRVLLAFPPYARWDQSSQTLVLAPDRYTIGSDTSTIDGNGLASDPATIPWRRRPNGTCDLSHVFIVAGTSHPNP